MMRFHRLCLLATLLAFPFAAGFEGGCDGTLDLSSLEDANLDYRKTASISGTVRDADSSDAVSDAQVKVEHSTAISDELGTFFIDGIRVGEHTLTVRAEGYIPLSTVITVETGANALDDLLLGHGSSNDPVCELIPVCDPPCASHEVCMAGGVCASTSACDPPCSAGEICNPLNGSCMAGCFPTCFPGEVCYGGFCYACDPPCSSGEYCTVNGYGFPPEPGGPICRPVPDCDPQCAEDEYCTDGDECALSVPCEPQCTTEEYCDIPAGTCRDVCFPGCAVDEICHDGECFECDPACGPGEYCSVTGIPFPAGPTCEPIVNCDPPCDSHEFCNISGECVENISCEPACDTNGYCDQGTCRAYQPCNPPCAGSDICVDGTCRAGCEPVCDSFEYCKL